jgi:hypothetical protein
MRTHAQQQLDLFVDIARVGVAGEKPKDPPLDEAKLQKELANTRQHVRNLIVMGMRPELTAEKREFVGKLERSARAEVRLRVKALQYFREQQRAQQ